MKLRHLALLGGIFTVIISLLLFLFIVTSDDEESGGGSRFDYSGMNLSAEVLKHQPTVEKYARKYGIEDYVNYLLAIMQVESGGTAVDVRYSMQIAMLKQLLARKLISEKEYTLVKQRLMKDYKVLSDITA